MKFIFFVVLIQFPAYSTGVQDLPLRYPIKEELPIGTIVADVKRDSGLASKYPRGQLSEFTFKFLKWRKDFAMNASSGIIVTSDVLDRDVICPGQLSCFIETDVAVYSLKHVGHVIKVLFDIIDINDNAPRFPENHISETLSEATLPGVLFPVRQAQDADSPEHGIDRYQLIPAGPTFALDVKRGEDGYFDLKLVLMQRLDRETQDFYQLKIIAYDKGTPPKSGSVMLHIEILDVNDNLPVFANGTYEVEIGENFPPVQSLLSVHATDADLGLNGAITYSFSPRTSALFSDKFSIDKHTGVISLLKVLDFEEASVIPLEVEAHNGGFEPVTTHVVVTVRDVNDNSPVIRIETTDGLRSGSAGSPVVFVAEHCAVGTFVAHLSVTDADVGSNGQVRCSLHSPQFQLVPMYETEFKLLTAGDLDREYLGVHHVVVTCHDLGQVMRSSFMNITVVVDDVNDHVPSLSHAFYNFSIVENNQVGALIGQVTATDPDKDDNGAIRYKFSDDSDGSVHVDPLSGIITAARALDREAASRLRLHIVAYDQSVERKSSTAVVSIDVRDVDDESPRFVLDKYTFHVSESVPVNHEVGRVVAYDRDAPPFNSFTFYLNTTETRGVSSPFSIDARTGSLFTRKLLNGSVDGWVYKLVACVKSTPISEKTDSTTVVIHITEMQIAGGASGLPVYNLADANENRHPGVSDWHTSTNALTVDEEPQYSGFYLPFIGGVQLAVFIGVATGGLVLISLLLVTLLTLGRRNRRKERPPSTTVTSANNTPWVNTERFKSPAITGKGGGMDLTRELSSQSDMDSYCEEDIPPLTFTSTQNYVSTSPWRNRRIDESSFLPPPSDDFLLPRMTLARDMAGFSNIIGGAPHGAIYSSAHNSPRHIISGAPCIPPLPSTSDYPVPAVNHGIYSTNNNNSQSSNASTDSLTTQLLITQLMTASMLEGRNDNVIEDFSMSASYLSEAVIRPGPVLEPPSHAEGFPFPPPNSSVGQSSQIVSGYPATLSSR